MTPPRTVVPDDIQAFATWAWNSGALPHPDALIRLIANPSEYEHLWDEWQQARQHGNGTTRRHLRAVAG